VYKRQALYNSCIRYAKTPRVWNDTMVCLIVKDHTRPKDADNVRPITLIGMFRKVFERLLLRRFDAGGWARVQPTQAGFRSRYRLVSTLQSSTPSWSLVESRMWSSSTSRLPSTWSITLFCWTSSVDEVVRRECKD